MGESRVCVCDDPLNGSGFHTSFLTSLHGFGHLRSCISAVSWQISPDHILGFIDPAFIEITDQSWAMTSFVEVPKKVD